MSGQDVGRWTPESILTVNTVGDVQPSPDGTRVALTLTKAVMTDDKSEYLTQIYVTNVDGSGTYQLTAGVESSSDPRWSPDGKWIAFSTGRSGKVNLWRIRADGGEAERLTDAPVGAIAVGSPYTAVTRFKWSPDGTQIAFVMPSPPSDAEIKRQKGKDDSRVVGQDAMMNQVWVVPVEKDAHGYRTARAITPAHLNVGSSVFWHYSFGGGFDWSPDGKQIVFSYTGTTNPNAWPSSDISVADTATGVIHPLVSTGAGEIVPLYSPDGRWIAYLAGDNPFTWDLTFTIYVLPAEGGTSRQLAETFDREPRSVAWSADSKRIYFTEDRGIGTSLSAVPIDGSPPQNVPVGNMVISDLNLNSTREMIGFVGQTATSSSEAYISRVDRFAPIQVSHANPDLPRYPLGRQEIIHWKSTDGLAIDALLNYPVGYRSGKKYPLILDIHGGPTGAFQQTFMAGRDLDSPAVFNAAGYAMLECNVRGSSGRGKAFRYANHKDWGGMDYVDLMTGVDRVVEMGVADPERLGVMGWSYGGYLSGVVITRTKRFKAAVVGAGISDLVSFTGTTDIPSFLPGHFGEELWSAEDFYIDRSAVFHGSQISTPTLILHGEADQRVPVSQGYELYNLLKRRGVTTEMVVYPRMLHGPGEPKMLRDIDRRTLEWFGKFLGGNDSP
jgi:dipeptidyl aminopeptidase/acylaminoacyl peptidase